MWDETYQGYGPRNVWKPLQPEGFRVARCTVGRLLRAMGLRGAVRGRAWITTTHAGDAARPRDLVDRQFVATRPNQLWVSDCTSVATWGGFVFVAVGIDVFARRIVGWRVSASMRTDCVLDARAQATHARGHDALAGLVHHSDRACSLSRCGIPTASPTLASRRPSGAAAMRTTVSMIAPLLGAV